MCLLGTVLHCGQGHHQVGPPREMHLYRGRKWRVSTHSTKREVVGTAFAAILAAMEHEMREAFTYQGAAIFGPHIPLANLEMASQAAPDARAGQ